MNFEGKENFEIQLKDFYGRWTEERRLEESEKKKGEKEEEERMKKYI